MATCPKCFQEKDLLATHCPHCVQRTEPEDQLMFSILAGLIQIGAVIGFLIWITS